MARADVFALYLKAKNFHWHVRGSHFRDYHLLFDEQAEQVLAMVDAIAERTRKLGGTTLHSIGDVASHQRLKDSDGESVSADAMLIELRVDNEQLTRFLHHTHELCIQYKDIATAALIDSWIDETEGRTWFLAQTTDDLIPA